MYLRQCHFLPHFLPNRNPKFLDSYLYPVVCFLRTTKASWMTTMPEHSNTEWSVVERYKLFLNFMSVMCVFCIELGLWIMALDFYFIVGCILIFSLITHVRVNTKVHCINNIPWPFAIGVKGTGKVQVCISSQSLWY